MITFSIIIPAHNSEKFIDKCLDSINKQTYKSFETIVVCDACEDKTKDVAEQYRAKTIVVNHHCDGLARNEGLNVAKGNWILFIDSDDWWLHEFVFEQIYNKLDISKMDVLAFGMIWRYIGYAGTRSVKGTLYPHVTNKCWNKSFIGDTRFPDRQVASDAGFHELMMQKNPRIEEWDMPLYYYNYLREGSKSVDIGRTVAKTKQYWSTH